MSNQITESQFYMWRAVFALAHADDVVTDEELRFMVEAIEDVPFSDLQKGILQGDVKEPQSVEEMFLKITEPVDQAGFFKFASQIVHIDGDFGEEEQAVMLKLKQMHLREMDVDALIGKVDLSLEEDESETPSNDFKSAVYSYREAFLKKIGGEG